MKKQKNDAPVSLDHVYQNPVDQILHYAVLFGIFLLPFVCLIVFNSTFFPFITGKNFTFRIITEIITALWMILAFRDKHFAPKSSYILYGFLMLLGTVFISDLLSPNVFKSFWSNYERMEGYVTLVHLFALFMVTASVMNKKLWEWLFRVSLGVSLILFVYGCIQLSGGLAIHQGSTRIDGTIGNSSYFGGYMLFHVFISLYLFIAFFLKKQRPEALSFLWPIFYGVVVIADSVTLFQTATRGAEIGLVVGLFCVSVLLAVFERSYLALRKIGISILVLVIFSSGFFVAFRHTSLIQNREAFQRLVLLFDEVVTLDKKVICDGEFKSRCLLWPVAVQGIAEKPIFGWGQESFNYVFNKYYDPRMYAQEQWFDRAHNVFLDWFIAGGVLGFLGYLSFFVFAIYYLWKKDAFSVLEKSVFTGLLVGYFFYNITVFDNFTSYLLFITVLAYIHGRVAMPIASVEEMIDSLDKNTIQVVIAPAAIVIGVVLVYVVNIPSMLASTELIKALSPSQGGITENLKHYQTALEYSGIGDSEIREQLVQTALQASSVAGLDPQMKVNIFDFARKQMLIQLAQTPDDARYHYFYGGLLKSFNDFDGAVKSLSRAHELSPNKQSILFELGSSYLAKSDFANGFAIMKLAASLDPTYAEAQKIYAATLIYGKHIDEAKTVLKKVAEDKGETYVLNDDRLLSAYYTAGYYEDALTHAVFLLKQDPTSPQYQFTVAAIHVKLGMRTKAIAELRAIAEGNPQAKDQVRDLIRKIEAGEDI